MTSAKRAAYDQRLRKRVQPRWAQPVAAEDAGAANCPQWAAILDYGPSTPRAHAVVKKRQTSLGPLIAVAIAGALVLAALLARSVIRRADNPTAPTEALVPIVRSAPGEPSGAKTEPDIPSPPITPNPPEESAVAKAGIPGPMRRPTFEKPAETIEKPLMPSFDPRSDNSSGQPTGPLIEPPVPKKRIAVPDDAKQREIAAQLAGVYAAGRASPQSGSGWPIGSFKRPRRQSNPTSGTCCSIRGVGWPARRATWPWHLRPSK